MQATDRGVVSKIPQQYVQLDRDNDLDLCEEWINSAFFSHDTDQVMDVY